MASKIQSKLVPNRRLSLSPSPQQLKNTARGTSGMINKKQLIRVGPSKNLFQLINCVSQQFLLEPQFDISDNENKNHLESNKTNKLKTLTKIESEQQFHQKSSSTDLQFRPAVNQFSKQMLDAKSTQQVVSVIQSFKLQFFTQVQMQQAVLKLLDCSKDSLVLAKQMSSLLFSPAIIQINAMKVQDFLVILWTKSISKSEKVIVLQQLIHECQNLQRLDSYRTEDFQDFKDGRKEHLEQRLKIAQMEIKLINKVLRKYENIKKRIKLQSLSNFKHREPEEKPNRIQPSVRQASICVQNKRRNKSNEMLHHKFANLNNNKPRASITSDNQFSISQILDSTMDLNDAVVQISDIDHIEESEVEFDQAVKPILVPFTQSRRAPVEQPTDSMSDSREMKFQLDIQVSAKQAIVIKIFDGDTADLIIQSMMSNEKVKQLNKEQLEKIENLIRQHCN